MGSFDFRHVDVFVGVDMAKQDHFAKAIDRDGNERFARSVANDQAAIEAVIDDAAQLGRVALVIDMPSSSAQLLLTIAQQRSVPVAYVTGLRMRRAAELYAGSAKTDPPDAWVLADFARRHAGQLVGIDVTDELLTKLRILNGRDVDLAEDATRARDALVNISPAHERALGSRLAHPGVRDLCSAPIRPDRAASRSAIEDQDGGRSALAAVVEALAAQTVTLTGDDTSGQIIACLVAGLERTHTARADWANRSRRSSSNTLSDRSW